MVDVFGSLDTIPQDYKSSNGIFCPPQLQQQQHRGHREEKNDESEKPKSLLVKGDEKEIATVREEKDGEEEPKIFLRELVEREEEKIASPHPVRLKGDPTRLITERLVVGRDCNAIIIADAHTKEALLIDPGGDRKIIVEWVKKLQVQVKQILVTHAHFDHIMAADNVRRDLRCPIWLHNKDLSLWRQLPEQMALLGLKRRGTRCVKRLPDPNYFLEDGSKLKILGGVTIHTPGHTPGSVCFYFPDYDVLISGDTLFKAHVGRTDLPGGDSAALRRSVLYKLYKLPVETRVLPGHGRETTIGFEMKNNRSCRVCTCKPKRKQSMEEQQREIPAHAHDTCCTTEKTGHFHSSGGNHTEGHVHSSGDCCEEADEADEEGDKGCTCGAESIPGKHQHVGEDMCSVL